MTKRKMGFVVSHSDPLAELKVTPRFVVGQLGQSLDGRIATRTGDSKYINHKEGLGHLHALRAIVDAVVVGVGTVNDDDPLLTVRLCEGRSPARVIIDPKGRVFQEAQLFDGNGPEVIILTAEGTQHPLAGSIELIELPTRNDRFDPADIVAALSVRGFHRLLIEGGSRTLSAFVDAGCLDRLHLIVAPMLVGGGFQGITLSAINKVHSALQPDVTLYHLGFDILFDCDLKSCSHN